MPKHFPYTIVTDKLQWIAGDYDYETRSYHKHGEEGEVGYWYQALTEHVGPLVTPGMVNMYVPVTRTAVHRRLKSGGLTSFYFHSKPAKEGLFAGKKEPRESPFLFIPARECRWWAEEIKTKKARLGQIELPEIDESEPEWHVAFYADGGSEDYGHYLADQFEMEQRFRKQIYKGLEPDHEKALREHIEKQQNAKNPDE